jgi:hypothetical protein
VCDQQQEIVERMDHFTGMLTQMRFVRPTRRALKFRAFLPGVLSSSRPMCGVKLVSEAEGEAEGCVGENSDASNPKIIIGDKIVRNDKSEIIN